MKGLKIIMRNNKLFKKVFSTTIALASLVTVGLTTPAVAYAQEAETEVNESSVEDAGGEEVICYGAPKGEVTVTPENEETQTQEQSQAEAQAEAQALTQALTQTKTQAQAQMQAQAQAQARAQEHAQAVAEARENRMNIIRKFIIIPGFNPYGTTNETQTNTQSETQPTAPVSQASANNMSAKTTESVSTVKVTAQNNQTTEASSKSALENQMNVLISEIVAANAEAQQTGVNKTVFHNDIAALTLPVMKTLSACPNVILDMTYTYDGVTYHTVIAGGATVEYDEAVPFYGPLWLFENYGVN